ncbi:zinc finger protein 32-like isoform X2 [Anneissia japonica]|uniref:zinc finger protein 32-like isoform X2 n=1 Tax=Anneissia japonica TaxID=1529436 RepID=UPI00142586E6|nr:zinc finger protein 32-like isoform X2 [Anneissia japonica]
MSDKEDEEILQDGISSSRITAEELKPTIDGQDVKETCTDAMQDICEPMVGLCTECDESEHDLVDSQRENNEDGCKTINKANMYESDSKKDVTNDVEILFDSLLGKQTDNESQTEIEKVIKVVEMIEFDQEQIIVDLPSLSNPSKRSRKKKDSSKKNVISSEPPTVQCSFCVKKFHTNDEKDWHEKYHTEEQPFKCVYCGKRFTSAGGQRCHERKFHTGEKLLNCRFCEKTFATSTAIRRHERVHTDDRPYGCVMCDATFKDSTDLRRHERRHTGEKPFKCKICDRAFTVRSAMNRHQRVHTGAKPFLCDLCGHAFTDRFSLKQHIKGHSRGQLYKCGVCNEGFSFRYHLHTHKKGCGSNLTMKDVEQKVTASKAVEKETMFLEVTENIMGQQTVYYVNPVSVCDKPSS